MFVYHVSVQSNASENKVITLSPDKLKVSVSAPAREGRANAALISLLAKHFNVSKSCVLILSGESGRQKKVGLVV